MDLLTADLPSLDREVARAWEAWERWRATLRHDPSVADDDPLERFRPLAGQSAYEALSRRDVSAADEPLREGLVRWLYALMQARVGRSLDAAVALAATDPSAQVVLEAPRATSWREAWRGVVAAKDRASSMSWLAAAQERGPAIAALSRERVARRVEVARRLGLEHPAAPWTRAPHAMLAAAAHELIHATSDLWAHVSREARARAGLSGLQPSPVDAIRLALARDAPEGWPAQLTRRWLADLFGDLTRGLRLVVALPSPLGAASFALALGRFGSAVREAGSSLPFALRRDPSFVDAHLFGLLFGSLAAAEPFQRRALQLSARVAAAQARSLAITALFEARSVAVRFLLCDEAQLAPRDRFEELTSALLGAPLATPYAGSWPLAAGDEGGRFEALLLAPAAIARLVERFDDDWFRNPRAAAHLRARASGPARDPAAPAVDTEAAVGRLAQAFEESLG